MTSDRIAIAAPTGRLLDEAIGLFARLRMDGVDAPADSRRLPCEDGEGRRRFLGLKTRRRSAQALIDALCVATADRRAA
jgi:hypothetical protein